MDWTLCEQLDRLRRQQGMLLDEFALPPVVEAAAGRDKTVLHYDGDVSVSLQHVGPLAGRRAHALLWPRILDWIERVG